MLDYVRGEVWTVGNKSERKDIVVELNVKQLMANKAVLFKQWKKTVVLPVPLLGQEDGLPKRKMPLFNK